MRGFIVLLMGISLGFGTACDVVEPVAESVVEAVVESPEEKMIRLKIERAGILDALYAEYGGGDLSNMAGQAASDIEEEEGANPIVDILAGAVGESDRAMFDANCDLIGAGERPAAFSTKAKEFFQTESVKARCIEAGRLGREIVSIQVELNAAKEALDAEQQAPAQP